MLRRALFGAGLLLALPAIAIAQDAAAGHDHAAGAAGHDHDATSAVDDAQIREWMTEMQQVHQQLEGLQQQALADPEIGAVQAALGEEIRVAMAAADPALDQELARMPELESQAVAAQQSGNTEAFQAVMSQAQQIQQRFMTVQQQVLEQPQIATKVTNFQTQLESKMVDLDPSAAGLIARFRSLETMLNDAIGPGA